MIIYHDQMSFITEMHIRFYICKSISAIYYINRLKGRNHIIIWLVLKSIQQSSKCFYDENPGGIRDRWSISQDTKGDV